MDERVKRGRGRRGGRRRGREWTEVNKTRDGGMDR